MASANPNADEATEALILQLIAQDFGGLGLAAADQQSPEDTEDAATYNTEAHSPILPNGTWSPATEDHPNLLSSRSSGVEETDSEAMSKRTRENAGLEPYSPSNSQHPINNLRIDSPAVERTFSAPYGQATSGFVGSENDFLTTNPPFVGNSQNKRAKFSPTEESGVPETLSSRRYGDDAGYALDDNNPHTPNQEFDELVDSDSDPDAEVQMEVDEDDDSDSSENDGEGPSDSSESDEEGPSEPSDSNPANATGSSDDEDGAPVANPPAQRSFPVGSMLRSSTGDLAMIDETGAPVPYFQIPWPGKPGWVESYVDESFSSYEYEGLGGARGGRGTGRGGYRIGGPTRAQIEANRRRKLEESTPTDIVVGEHETADSIIMELVRREEREAKGKAKTAGGKVARIKEIQKDLKQAGCKAQ